MKITKITFFLSIETSAKKMTRDLMVEKNVCFLNCFVCLCENETRFLGDLKWEIFHLIKLNKFIKSGSKLKITSNWNLWIKNYRFYIAIIFTGSVTYLISEIYSSIIVSVNGFAKMNCIFQFLLQHGLKLRWNLVTIRWNSIKF